MNNSAELKEIILQKRKKKSCRIKGNDSAEGKDNTAQLEKPFFLSHLFTHWELASPEIQCEIC